MTAVRSFLRAKTMLPIAALLLAALTPLVANAASLPPVACATAPGCPDPTGACTGPAFDPTQAVHFFVLAGDFGATTDGGFGGAGVGAVSDTSGCLDGDGDPETGVGAAKFPEVAEGTACDAPNGHHGGGPGATVTVTSNTANLPVDYVAGTDGQDPVAWEAGQRCTGNGLISDSYDTDPFDCGQGVTGHFPTGPSATVEPNFYGDGGPGVWGVLGGIFPGVALAQPDPWAALFGPVSMGSYRTDPNGGVCQGVSDGSVWASLASGVALHGVDSSVEGCPAPVGDGTGTLGGWGCGVSVGSVGVGVSTPIDGDIVDP